MTDTFQIPGKPTLAAGMCVPAIMVRLPLAAGPRRGALAIVVVSMALLGAILLSVVALLVFGLSLSRDAGSVAMFVLVVPIAAAMGVCCTGAAIISLVDLTRASPILVVSEEGLEDRRSLSCTIPWTDVSRAEIKFTAGPAAVHLRLKHPLQARQNPFRIGTLGFYWRRRRPNELHVPLRFLDTDPHVLAFTIIAMVGRHGRAVETALPQFQVPKKPGSGAR